MTTADLAQAALAVTDAWLEAYRERDMERASRPFAADMGVVVFGTGPEINDVSGLRIFANISSVTGPRLKPRRSKEGTPQRAWRVAPSSWLSNTILDIASMNVTRQHPAGLPSYLSVTVRN